MSRFELISLLFLSMSLLEGVMNQQSGHFFERFHKAFRACSSRIEQFYQS